MVLRQTNAQIK